MRPVIPVKVEHDTEAYDVVETKSGAREIVRGVRWTLTPDQLLRIAEGYACLNCLEPFESVRRTGKCPLCNYNLSDQQHDLERLHRGGEHVGPETTLYDERERMKWEAEERRHQTGSSIFLP